MSGLTSLHYRSDWGTQNYKRAGQLFSGVDVEHLSNTFLLKIILKSVSKICRVRQYGGGVILETKTIIKGYDFILIYLRS